MPALISEKELEDYIVNEISEQRVNPLTGETVDHCFRQVAIGSYGIADIVFVDIWQGDGLPPEVFITIIELKKDLITVSAIAQISRYKTGIEQYLSKETSIKITVEGILVGSGYAHTDDASFLVDSIDWLTCYHYKLSLSTGIFFTESYGWRNEVSDFSSMQKLAQPIIKKLLSGYRKSGRR